MTTLRQAWRLRIRPDCEAEYRRRHAEIWPSVLDRLRRSGVVTFSIYVDGLDVFLYCEIDPDRAVRGAPPVEDKPTWNAFMDEVLEPRPPERRLLDEIFHFEAEPDRPR